MVARVWGRKPGNWGLDAPFPGPVLDALACPLYSGPPGALRPAATRSRGAAGRAPVIKLPPACGPGDGGYAPPTANRHLGVPGPAAPRWTRVTSRALFIGAPPASLRSVLDARIVWRGSAGRQCRPLHPTATAKRSGRGSPRFYPV